MATNKTRTNRQLTNMQQKVEIDWTLAEEAVGWHRASGKCSSGTRKGSRELVVSARVTWRRSCEEELKQYGLTWMQVKRTAEDRSKWRRAVETLCSTRNPKEQ
uniref:Uncharacterized protein n=1 Tax=Trichobilharzia regenti TaxID=157069 RepID=A0AA85KFH9_TRIRE|nr:unnamed protein product [Trichobilharzia regenti]